MGYGASILSFLGGIHWALAMAEYGGALKPKALLLAFLSSPFKIHPSLCPMANTVYKQLWQAELFYFAMIMPDTVSLLEE